MRKIFTTGKKGSHIEINRKRIVLIQDDTTTRNTETFSANREDDVISTFDQNTYRIIKITMRRSRNPITFF